MWPFSSSSADATAQPQTTPTATSPVQKPNDAPTQAAHPPTTAPPHDPDFYAAHPHLAPPSVTSNTTPSTPNNNNTSSTNPSDASPIPDDLDPTLPRSMSCRAAFDSAFYCSSLGGHFNDIYRYGQLRSCSEHWNDFWFCMRTKNSYSGEDVKERMVQDRYKEKEEKLKSGPNSEDVWVRRGPGEEIKDAFSRPAAEVEDR